MSEPTDPTPDQTPDAPEPTPFDASFDMSDVRVSDVSMPDTDEPTPDHSASADEPPLLIGMDGGRKGGRKGRRKEREVPPKPRVGSLVKPLEQFYASIGVTVSAFDPACGLVLMDNARPCAESLDTLARENEAVRRAILMLTQTSAWGGVMIAHLPILVMIATHHGPREVAERTAPLAGMLAPNAMNVAMQAEAQRAAQTNGGPAA